MREVAISYFEQGLSVLPIGEDKHPVKGFMWKPRQTELIKPNGEFTNALRIGIICGAVSMGVECLDIDLKYDLSGNLKERLKTLVNESEPTLLKRLLVEQTPTGGYHFVYRYQAEEYQGNLKLASRYSTEQEREVNPKEKVKVLLETRGAGGYFVCAPSEGYSVVQGSFGNIPWITHAERNTLIACARSLNEVPDEIAIPKAPRKERIEGLTTFDDYNKRGDVLQVLIDSGWTITKENSKNYFLKRPGVTDSKWSATLHKETSTFYVFSSSTEFDASKGHSPVSVYGTLKHNKDWSATALDLSRQGYGEKREYRNTEQAKPVEPNQPEPVKEKLHFLASKQKVADYINSVIDGTLPMGLLTGMPALDAHFRFKRASFNVIGGHDNVGKTVVILFLLMQSAKLHNWKWGIASLENSAGSLFRTLIEFYYGVSIKKLTPEQVNEASRFIARHFYFIDNENSYSYKDILNMGQTLYEEKNIDGLFIDPYNSLELDAQDLKLLGSHDYHYKVTTEFRKFCKRNDCCIYLNCHAVTEALRRVWTKDATKESDLVGHPMPPKKSDVEGGGKFANRADDFLIIHRYTQNEARYRITELHVVKTKETNTGGMNTALHSPVKIEMAEGNCGFIEYESKLNPVTQKITPTNTNYEPWNDK